MYQHAEKHAFDRIRFDADTMFKREELRLKEAGQLNDKTYNEARIRMQKYETDAQTQWRTYHVNALLSGQRSAEDRADARTESAERIAGIRADSANRSQNLRSSVDLVKKQLDVIGLSASRKKELEEQLGSLSAMLNKELGIAALAKPPSIQIPDSSGAGKPIYD